MAKKKEQPMDHIAKLYQKHDYKEMVKEWEVARTQPISKPNNAYLEMLTNIGIAYAHLGQYEKAINCWENVLEQTGLSATLRSVVLCNLATAYLNGRSGLANPHNVAKAGELMASVDLSSVPARDLDIIKAARTAHLESLVSENPVYVSMPSKETVQ